MTLSELHARLAPSFSPSIRKDLQTAVRVLAKALNCPDPQHCSLEQYNQPLPSLYQRVEAYLHAEGKGPHTVRNTKNNVSRLFRLAEEQQLFSLRPPQLTQCYPLSHNHPPPRPRPYAAQRKHGCSLPYTAWPRDLQQAFTDLTTWATDPLVAGRDASLRKRPRTMENYRYVFAGYFGFLHHMLHLTPLTFEQLFDLPLVTQYVHWHVNDVHGCVTRIIHNFLTILLAITRQYRPLPEFRAQLSALQKTLPKPTPVYHKEDAWVSLKDLEEIGRALWPHKQPQDVLRGDSKHPGLLYAVQAGLSLMLRLWVRIPYRQRNIREMRLGDNLHKDAQGRWQITFRGEQLKVAIRRGRPNVFTLRFPNILVPILEDYLQIWRPILLAKASQPCDAVFLTRNGTPYSLQALHALTKYTVYRYTGKHWHPHIIRTVWATEWLRQNHGNFYRVAYMLNDKLETVVDNYAHMLDDNVEEEVYQLLEERLSQGK